MVADLRTTDEFDTGYRAAQLVACCHSLEPDLHDPPFIQALVSDELLYEPDAQEARASLTVLAQPAGLTPSTAS